MATHAATDVALPHSPLAPVVRLRAPRVRLLGATFDAVTGDEAVADVMAAVRAGRSRWVITANLDHLRRHHADRAVRDLLGQADSIVADGTPIVWASRIARCPLPERVAGSDLVWSLAAALEAESRSLYLLGADPGVAAKAAATLQERHPDLDIVGLHSPPRGFELQPEERREITARLLATRPDVVYVALGFPKQDHLIQELRLLLPSTTFIGVGISLSFIAGEVVRAPAWMHTLGLEWTHRMVQDPARLVRRYLVDGIPFAARLFAGALRARLSPAARGGSFAALDGR